MNERTQQLARELTQLHFEKPADASQLGLLAPAKGEDSVVYRLGSAEGPLLAGELGEQTNLSTGRISNILRKLEAKGLVRRIQDERDRRCVHVSLTAAGRAHAQQLEANVVASHADMLERLGADDAAELVRIVRRCVKSAHDAAR